jgi:apolipoprotein D and lipocalin family protein
MFLEAEHERRYFVIVSTSGMNFLFLTLLTTVMSTVSSVPLQTVPSVNLEKYAGRWYEIASFPQRFQKGCHCTFAEYTPTGKGYVRVYNSCRRDSSRGKEPTITGRAYPVKGSNNAKLRVQFFWPFRGDYWIIELADDYSYAVVGAPGRNYLWILSRSPKMSDEAYATLLSKVSAMGFDISRLQKTDQSCY